MKKLLKSRIKSFDAVAIIFSIAWILILTFDYFNKHAIYLDSVQHFKYFRLTIFYIVLGALFVWIFDKDSKILNKKRSHFFIPFTLLLFPISILALAISYSKFYFQDISTGDYVYLLGQALYVFLAGFIVLFACYCIGARVSQTFLNKKVISKSHYTLDLGIGICIFILFLFGVAAFHLLNWIGALVLILLAIGLNYKFAWKGIVGIISFNPNYNKLQLALLYLIGILFIINFIFILGPYPLGFDSRNYYLNIPKIIAAHNGLVEGFQPYNWELFISIGIVLFKKIEVSMFLAQIGAILASASAYQIARSIFRLDKTGAMLISLILIITPAISRQMFIELKVDLALLFLQIITIHLFVSYKIYKNKKENAMYIFSIILGILLGIGLGIKLLHFFLIFALFAALTLDKNKVYGLMFIILFGFGAILFLKLDDHTGLRGYHKHVNILSYILLAAGFLSGAWYLYTDFAKAKKSLVQMAIILTTCIVTISPWMAKTYYDTGSTNVIKLLRGSGSGHDIDQQKMSEIYNKIKSEE
ncbi:MAG: hypothetical protein V3V00_13520 [Saprospiraceae bacterium]